MSPWVRTLVMEAARGVLAALGAAAGQALAQAVEARLSPPEPAPGPVVKRRRGTKRRAVKRRVP